MKRRDFLRSALSALAILPLGRNAWALRAPATGRKRLIVIFLRGAVDGLNVVVPYQESAYYAMRPNLAIPPPGRAGGALDLDGRFALHPALEPLMPLWRNKSLAFIPASGSPDPSRSHFDAQAYMETATPGVKTTHDGWLNRLLAQFPGPHSPTEALSVGPTIPLIFDGRMAVANLPLGKAATAPMPMDRPLIADAFEKLYSGEDPLSRSFREGLRARKELLAKLRVEEHMADNGAPSPVGFPQDAARLGRLMRDDTGIRLAFMALGGWDTHINQGASSGQLANNLRLLGQGVGALVSALGPAYADTVITLISEFGRTAHENGNNGTDHGHGNVMWVVGGPVRGGRIYGQWPGLDEEQLYQGRDVAVTTDFRSPLRAILAQHLALTPAQIARVLPAFEPETDFTGLFA